MAVLGLRFCARAFSSSGKRGPLFIAVRGPLTIAASLVTEHRLQTCRLSNCGSRAQLLRSMWDLPRPGLEPVSPAMAGRLSTAAPPGKSPAHLLHFHDTNLLSQSSVHCILPILIMWYFYFCPFGDFYNIDCFLLLSHMGHIEAYCSFSTLNAIFAIDF